MVEKEAIKYEPIREYIEKKSLKKDRNPLIFYSYAVSMSLSLVGREG
jgi:hypothetical protein